MPINVTFSDSKKKRQRIRSFITSRVTISDLAEMHYVSFANAEPLPVLLNAETAADGGA